MSRARLASSFPLHVFRIDQGLTPGSSLKWVNLMTTVGRANKMLNTTFAIFASSEGVERIRALQYSVPEEVVNHITMVAPIIRFGQIQRQRSQVLEEVAAAESFQASEIPSTELNVTACNSTMTPECLRALYKVGDYQSEPTERSLFGVCGYLEVSNSQSRLSPVRGGELYCSGNLGGRYKSLWNLHVREEYLPRQPSSRGGPGRKEGRVMLDQCGQRASRQGRGSITYAPGAENTPEPSGVEVSHQKKKLTRSSNGHDTACLHGLLRPMPRTPRTPTSPLS